MFTIFIVPFMHFREWDWMSSEMGRWGLSVMQVRFLIAKMYVQVYWPRIWYFMLLRNLSRTFHSNVWMLELIGTSVSRARPSSGDSTQWWHDHLMCNSRRREWKRRRRKKKKSCHLHLDGIASSVARWQILQCSIAEQQSFKPEWPNIYNLKI